MNRVLFPLHLLHVTNRYVGLLAHPILHLHLPPSVVGSPGASLQTWLLRISAATPSPCTTSFRNPERTRCTHGFHAGAFLQLVFPATDDFPSSSGYFAMALYLTSVSTKGRVMEEDPDVEIKDSRASHVSNFSGIILPFLLQREVDSYECTSQGAVTVSLNQLHLPLFARVGPY